MNADQTYDILLKLIALATLALTILAKFPWNKVRPLRRPAKKSA